MLYDVKTTRKLEKKIISQNNTELSLMFKAGTAIFNHINELNKKDIIIFKGKFRGKINLSYWPRQQWRRWICSSHSSLFK